ncbi:MAG: hypothetical protein R6V83_08340 [Candidatus Thorarchaeota archaeon]
MRHTEALVVPEQIPSVETSLEVHIDINRKPISPYDAHGSLANVERVEKKIRTVLPAGTNCRSYPGGALGTDRDSIMGPLLADAVASILGAAIIGSIISLILVFFALQIPLAFLGPTSSLQWFRLPVRISVPIVLLTTIVAVTLMVVVVTVYFVTKSHLERSVAEEILYVS